MDLQAIYIDGSKITFSIDNGSLKKAAPMPRQRGLVLPPPPEPQSVLTESSLAPWIRLASVEFGAFGGANNEKFLIEWSTPGKDFVSMSFDDKERMVEIKIGDHKTQRKVISIVKIHTGNFTDVNFISGWDPYQHGQHPNHGERSVLGPRLRDLPAIWPSHLGTGAPFH